MFQKMTHRWMVHRGNLREFRVVNGLLQQKSVVATPDLSDEPDRVVDWCDEYYTGLWTFGCAD
jgi:hypothetical protein